MSYLFLAFGRFRLFLLVFVATGMLQVHAQTDDLMFVEYVDWTNGSGWAVKVYNPTNASIDLSDYYFRIYRNGANVFTENENLSGSLAAKQTVIIGNEEYCNQECSGSCGIVLSTLGINGNEILELATATCTIDLIGAKGVDLGSQNGWTVDGTTKATYRKTLTRRSDNGIRYTKSDGVAPYSWPSDRSNFTGWEVSAVRCLSNGFTLSVTVPSNSSPVSFNFEDSTICVGQTIVISAGQSVDWENLETGQTINNARNWTFSEAAGTYHIVGYSRGCGSNDTAIVRVRDAGSITIFGDVEVCEGEDLTFYTDRAGGNLWQSTTTVDTFTLTNVQSDTKVFVENRIAGCGLAYDTLSIQVLTKPLLPTVRNRSVAMSGDSTIDIDRTSAMYPYTEWTVNGAKWSAASVDYIHPETLLVCQIIGPSEGCVDSTCVSYEPEVMRPPFIVFIPNVITPNNDNLNDVFRIYVEGGEVEFLDIYNRWGERLYKGAVDAEWNGKYHSKFVPNGTYFYVGSVRETGTNNLESISGTIEVIR